MEQSLNEPLQFQFFQWKECFQKWKELHQIYGSKITFVLSTHWATSGYWIENSSENANYSSSEDRHYSAEEVIDLERRVSEEIMLAEREHRSPQFIN